MTTTTPTKTITPDDIKSRIVEFMESDWDEEAFIATLTSEERDAYFACSDNLSFTVQVHFDD